MSQRGEPLLSPRGCLALLAVALIVLGVALIGDWDRRHPAPQATLPVSVD